MALQRVRIVCISDTHNQTPRLPPGDVLIHAGDLTRQGNSSELQTAFHWLDNTDFKAKIVIAGNHDSGLDESYPQEDKYGQSKEQIQANIELFKSSDIHYLQHESKIIKLPNEDGTEVRFKVFGSPYSPNRRNWAFSYSPSEGQLWESIPLDTDMVVAHTPARSHLDESNCSGPAGCESLRATLWRVRPKLFVCGHIHEARGVEVVEWDVSAANSGVSERLVKKIEDRRPAGPQQFCIDLSSKAAHPLLNHNAESEMISLSDQKETRHIKVTGNAKKRGPKIVSTMGQGGAVLDTQADEQVFAFRPGRRQTCMINAAFLRRDKSSRGKTGKPINKPIVVDLDLLVYNT